MKKKTQELSRRQMLAAMAISSLGGVAKGSVFNPAKTSSDFFRPIKSRIVTINAKPEPIAIDISKTAVIVIDMQNDFGSKGGMFDLAGIDISIIQKAVGPLRKPCPRSATLALGSSILRWGIIPTSRISVLPTR